MKKRYKQLLWIIIITITITFGCILVNTKLIQTGKNNNLPKSTPENDNNINKKPLEEESEYINMNLEVNGQEYKVTLYKNKTTEKLIDNLPLEINMNDLNNNEKYYYFEQSFPTSPSPQSKIEVGDIMLYGDNCLVIFYETFSTNYSYTKIGKIENTSNLKANLLGPSVMIKLYNS